MTPDDPLFLNQHAAVFGELLARVDEAIAELPAPPILTIPALTIPAPSDRDSDALQASRESWSLLRAGLCHLQAGAPGRRPGGLGGAVRCASLRAAPLAASLGLPPPVFEELPHPLPCHDGIAAAVFSARRFGEAATQDIDASRPVIARALQGLRPPEAAGLRRHAARFFAALDGAHARNLSRLMVFVEKI